MHTLFAIEPQAINNWHDLRYALEKFGYSKGLLIASFPKAWMRLVMEACEGNGLGDVELTRIEEKLLQAKEDRLVRLGLPFAGHDWLDNARQEAVRASLSAVLVKDKSDEELFHCLAEADEALFNNRRDTQVKRTAQALASAARHVLLSSDRITLIDPYFQPKSQCCKVLEEMVALCCAANHRLTQVNIFAARSKDLRAVERITADYQELLAATLKTGVRVQVYLLPDEALDEDFHARYLLGLRAGLRFDRGFLEPMDHFQREHLTDVACLDDAMVAHLHSRYLRYEGGVDGVQSITLPVA
jgi:hypothetical protein